MKLDIEKLNKLSFTELQSIIECSESITTNHSFAKRDFIKREVRKVMKNKLEDLFIENEKINL